VLRRRCLWWQLSPPPPPKNLDPQVASYHLVSYEVAPEDATTGWAYSMGVVQQDGKTIVCFSRPVDAPAAKASPKLNLPGARRGAAGTRGLESEVWGCPGATALQAMPVPSLLPGSMHFPGHAWPSTHHFWDPPSA
jgi:hypothetical protein